MKLRRLTEDGIARFTEFLDSLSTDAPLVYPEEVLEDEQFTSSVEPSTDFEVQEFASRFDFAKYLDGLLSRARLQGVEGDIGLWAWLALLLFEQLCRTSDEGDYRPGEIARWIPANDNFRKYYRHLLRGPYSIYRAHQDRPERALALLCGPISEPGDVVEQLSARQELVTNAAIVQVSTDLYLDPEKKILRRGAAGRGPGSARRLADLFNQLDVTWDLYGMEPSKLAALLPKEFDKYKQ